MPAEPSEKTTKAPIDEVDHGRCVDSAKPPSGRSALLVSEWHCGTQLTSTNGAEPGDDAFSGHRARALHADEAVGVSDPAAGDSTAGQLRDHPNRYCMRNRHGTERTTEDAVQVVRARDDGMVGVISLFHNPSAHRLAALPGDGLPPEISQFLTTEFRGIVFQSVHDGEGRHRYTYMAGRMLAEIGTDTTADQYEPEAVFDLVHSDDRSMLRKALASSQRAGSDIDMVLRVRLPENGLSWLRLIGRPETHDDGSVTWNGVAIDVTREQEAVRRSQWLATHDHLTGLITRTEFAHHLQQVLTISGAGPRNVGVAHVGVRGMLRINEAQGFAAGDELLRQLAGRLERALSATDTVARSHGDNFLVMIDLAASDSDLGETIERLRATCNKPFELVTGTSVRVELTIGVARFPDHGTSAEKLVRAATLAADRAGKRPEMAYDFYARDLSENIRKRFHTERHLRNAIETESLDAYFQPQISLTDGSVIGLEALVRWPLDDGRLILPSDFIPLAEETGLIGPLGMVVLRRVVENLQTWDKGGLTVPPVAVNCSAQQFRASGFAEAYQTEVMDQGIAPSSLALEITENSLIDDFESAEHTMQALSDRGVHFSIDDFGTGFSSLGYLARLPFHVLKIDGRFVADVAVDERQQSIVRGLIQMARGLGLYVIGEGVETAEQADELRRLGCDAGQGFHYGAPVPAAEIERWIS